MLSVCEHANKAAPPANMNSVAAEKRATLSETEYGCWLAEQRLNRTANASTNSNPIDNNNNNNNAATAAAVIVEQQQQQQPKTATIVESTSTRTGGLFNIWRIGPQERPPPAIVVPEPPKAKGVCPIDHSWLTGGKKATKEDAAAVFVVDSSTPASTTPTEASTLAATPTITTPPALVTTISQPANSVPSREELSKISAQAAKIDSQLKL